MRDVLLVVTIIGLLGMMFVFALAVTKYGEALEKQRQPEAKDVRDGSTRRTTVWQRETDAPLLAALAILLAAIVIGQVVANGLDISGGSRILVSGAAVFVLTWCVVAVLMLRTYRRNRGSPE